MHHWNWYSLVSALVLMHILGYPINITASLPASPCEAIAVVQPEGDPGHGGGGLAVDELPTSTPTSQPEGDPGHGGGGLAADELPTSTPTSQPEGDPGHGGGGLAADELMMVDLDRGNKLQ